MSISVDIHADRCLASIAGEPHVLSLPSLQLLFAEEHR
jgi:hypothetical protein